jgi:hypothetical protein
MKPGCADGAGRFETGECQTNQDHWTEGYKIVDAGNAFEGSIGEYLRSQGVPQFGFSLRTCLRPHRWVA